jgi:peptidoglycan/LPS O-acetylase OafA/YrhL
VVLPIAALCAFVVVWSTLSSSPSLVVERVLGHPLLQALGKRSYSLYLWHYLVGMAIIAGFTRSPAGWEGPSGEGWRGPTVFAIQLAASLAVAGAAYQWIEVPARRVLNGVWRKRFAAAPGEVEARAT